MVFHGEACQSFSANFSPNVLWIYMASRTSFHCFLLAIALFTACLQGSVGIDLSLRFIKEPEDVFAKRNQPVELDCSGFSSPEYGPVNVTWYHNKGLLVNDARKQILTNGSLYIRKVRYKKHNGSSSSGSSSASASANGNADVSDAGVYSCAISNGEGTLVSRPAHLYIATMSKKLNEEPKSHVVEEGDAVQFRCQIQAFPVPTYFWQRDQNISHDGDSWFTILPQVDGRFTVLPAGVFQINRVVASDAGKYRCTAHNIEHNQSSTEAVLQIAPATKMYRSPEFLDTETRVTFHTGETAILECMAKGYPNPTISWARQDGKEMRTKVTSIAGQGNLVLYSVNAMDDGTYVCTASNKNPNTMETRSKAQVVQLRVLMSPKFLKQPQSVIDPLGKTARFECEVQGFPPPTVRWLKDGHFIEIYGRIKQKNISSNELVILQTIKADSGIYQCVAENIAGYGSVAARLEVSTSQDQPDPPTVLRAVTRSNTSIELHWNAAVSRNGLPIQAYTVHYYVASGTDVSSGGQEQQEVSVNTSYTVEKLIPYTNYTFYVRAYNDKSASEQSESITWTTGEDIPLSAPSVSLTSSMTSLHVVWDELPSRFARGVVTMYKIQWRKRNHAYYDIGEVPGYVREYTITEGLLPGKKYDVRVLAATKMGYPNLPDEKWPWVTHEMPNHVALHVPLPPILHHQLINSTAVKILWKLPEENEFEATGYNLSYQKQSHRIWRSHLVSSNVTQYVITDLELQTWYEVHIYGFNENGNGREAVSIVSTADAPPLPRDEYDPVRPIVEPPTHLEASSTDPRVIHLKWESPHTNKNVSYFTVRYNPVHNTSSVNSSMVSYIRSEKQEVKITDLTPYTQYEFSVRSHTQDAVPGPYGNKVECKTQEDVPTAPRRLRWKPLSPHTVRLTWQPPQYPNGVIISYDIMYNSARDPNNSMEKWYTFKEQGSKFSSLVNDLDSNTLYYLCMRAETRAGVGPSSEMLAFNIPVVSLKNNSMNRRPAFEGELQDPKIGIIVGVTIGICCIIICALIIVCRNRCFPQPHELHIHGRHHAHHWGNGYVTRVNGNGYVPREYRISSSESHEMDSITPMLGLTQIPDTISSHLDSKGGYAMCVPYLGGQVEPNGGTATHYSNGHAGQQQLLINITENPQFEIGSEFAQGDVNKPCGTLGGSPSSSAPLLGGSSGQNSVSSDGNQSSTVAASQATGNNARDQPQPAMNGHSHRNGHQVAHHNSNGNHHHHHHHHQHPHSHSHHSHGAKRSKRNSAGATSNATDTSSANALAPLHGSTSQPEVQCGPAVTTTAAVVTIPPASGKHSRRRRPLSHTAICATPNSVGASCSVSSPSMMTSANAAGGHEQRLATSPKPGCRTSGSDNGGRLRQSGTQRQQSQSSPSSSTSPSSSSTSSSSSCSATQPFNANSHKILAPT